MEGLLPTEGVANTERNVLSTLYENYMLFSFRAGGRKWRNCKQTGRFSGLPQDVLPNTTRMGGDNCLSPPSGALASGKTLRHRL
jgi:hypothetical protein